MRSFGTPVRFGLLARFGVLGVLAVVATACPPLPTPEPPHPVIEGLLSAGNGALPNSNVGEGAISADGSMVAFTSDASNLVSGPDSPTRDLFYRNMNTLVTTRIADDVPGKLTMSSNGRYVGFKTEPLNLNVFDIETGTTTTWVDPEVSTASTVPLVTPDGSVAIYGLPAYFGMLTKACRVRDLSTGSTTNCPSGFGTTGTPAIHSTSANGRFVVYGFSDTGGGPGGNRIWDRETDTVELLPVEFFVYYSMIGISDDGRYVSTRDSGLPSEAGIIRFDLVAGTSKSAMVAPQSVGGMSPDGRYIAFSSDNDLSPFDSNGSSDTYVWDAESDTSEVKSIDTVTGGRWAWVSGPCLSEAGQVTNAGQTCMMGVSDGSNGVTGLQSNLYLR